MVNFVRLDNALLFWLKYSQLSAKKSPAVISMLVMSAKAKPLDAMAASSEALSAVGVPPFSLTVSGIIGSFMRQPYHRLSVLSPSAAAL